MHIETTAQSFLAALKDSLKVEKSSAIPVLSQVRVTDQKITATDLDNWTAVRFDGTGTADFLLPYHQVVGVLSGEKGKLTIEITPGTIRSYEVTNCEECKGYRHCAPHAKVTKDTKGATPVYAPSQAKLSINGCEYIFESLPLERWPVRPVVTSDVSSGIAANAFGTLLERTRFAISREESRYTINGLKLEIAAGAAMMIATDGHRLSLAESDATGANLTALVSSSAVTWLQSKAGKDDVIVTADESHISFDLGDKEITTRKMTGQFPNYEAVMPRNHKAFVTIPNADSLGKTLARVAKCADERSGCTRWTFGPDSSVAAESSERGKAKATLDCTIVAEKGEGDFEGFTVGFAAQYVGEFLKLAGKEPVKVSLKDAQSAALFTSGEGWKYVVMPMRI